MALDATVPVLVSLVLLATVVVAGAALDHLLTHRTHRPVRSTLRARTRALRCPRIVLIDDGARGLATATS